MQNDDQICPFVLNNDSQLHLTNLTLKSPVMQNNIEIAPLPKVTFEINCLFKITLKSFVYATLNKILPK